jgi:hypothetical protein
MENGRPCHRAISRTAAQDPSRSFQAVSLVDGPLSPEEGPFLRAQQGCDLSLLSR